MEAAEEEQADIPKDDKRVKEDVIIETAVLLYYDRGTFISLYYSRPFILLPVR